MMMFVLYPSWARREAAREREKTAAATEAMMLAVNVFSGPIVQSSRTDENSVTFIRTKIEWLFASHCRHHSRSRCHRRQQRRSEQKKYNNLSNKVTRFIEVYTVYHMKN